MRYIDIDLYVLKTDIAFITRAILAQLHFVFNKLPMAIDFPNYTENEPNSTTELNSKILFANSGNKIRLFTLDPYITREKVIKILDLNRLIAADAIEVSNFKQAPLTTSFVMYYRDRVIDRMRAKDKKLRKLRLKLNAEAKEDTFLAGTKRTVSDTEVALRNALKLMTKTSIGVAHTRINISRESMSTNREFSLHLVREVVEKSENSTVFFDNLTSYGISKSKSSAVYLPRF